MAQEPKLFEWPEGVLTVASSFKHMCGRRIVDLMGSNEKLEKVIAHLAGQKITVLGHLLGRNPSEILPLSHIPNKDAELFYGVLGHYGIVPMSEIRKIDRTGGYYDFKFPGLELP